MKHNGPAITIKQSIVERAGAEPIGHCIARSHFCAQGNLAQTVEFVRRRQAIVGPITALAGAKKHNGCDWWLFRGIVSISGRAKAVRIFHE